MTNTDRFGRVEIDALLGPLNGVEHENAPCDLFYAADAAACGRTMALITHATIIVEASEMSHVLQQGWEALRLGRPFFIPDWLMNDPALRWPSELAHYGAMSLSTDALNPVLEFLPEGSRIDFASLEF
jgi:hypothetical protein